MNTIADGIRSVVIVYYPEHTDWQLAVENANLREPYVVRSFLVSPGNKALSELPEAIQDATVVILPVGQLGLKGSAVELVMESILSDPIEDRDVLFFNKDYTMYVEPEIPVINPGVTSFAADQQINTGSAQ